MEVAYGHPKSLKSVQTKYCPGCGHGVIHRIICEVIDEMGLREKSVITNPVGCSIWADLYFDIDSVQPAHGRTPAAATGVKRMLPDHLVVCYQGDGDLAAIGTAEIVHAANRGEKFTTIFVNNAIYGMTGGQMAPTTLTKQRTTTCVEGRDVEHHGSPLRMAELLATLRTEAFIARGAAHTPRAIIRTKRLLKEAFSYQVAGRCFSLVEVLSTCPTNWGLSPARSADWLEEHMIPYYPLGIFKTPGGEDRAPAPLGRDFRGGA